MLETGLQFASWRSRAAGQRGAKKPRSRFEARGSELSLPYVASLNRVVTTKIAAEIPCAAKSAADIARAASRDAALIDTKITAQIAGTAARLVLAPAQTASCRTRGPSRQSIDAAASRTAETTHAATSGSRSVASQPTQGTAAELAAATIDRHLELVGSLADGSAAAGAAAG